MKKTSILLSVTALFIFVSFNSCKKTEGCTDVTALNYDPDAEVNAGCLYEELYPVELHMHQYVGAEELVEESIYNLGGVETKLNLVQFYISAIKLVDADGLETPAEGVYLLMKPEQEEYEIGNFPAGNYTKVIFDIGIDSVTNHGDPSLYQIGDPLGAQFPNMHWGWSFGYIFVRIDGEADVNGDGTPDNPDGLFEMHLGSDHYVATIEVDLPVTIGATNENILHLKTQCETFFTGVDLATDNTTHSTDNTVLAGILYDNLFNMFSPED